MKLFKNLLLKNKQNLVITKINLNYYNKQYMYYILDNTYILSLKHFELKLNSNYKLIKHILFQNGKIGFLNFFTIFNNLNNINFFFKHSTNIYNFWRGGYFTTNFYIKKKELSDIYIFGDIAKNSFYIFNEIKILKKPIMSFIRFDYKFFNLILYKLYGNFANFDVLFFYKKIIFYYIYKSLILKKLHFYRYLI